MAIDDSLKSGKLETAKTKPNRILIYIVWLVGGLVITAFFIGPFIWMILTSVKPPEEVLTWPPRFWPSRFSTTNFRVAWQFANWPRMFFNSIFITFSATFGLIFFASLAGFAFARMRFPLKDFLFWMVLATMMVPIQVDLIPRFLMMAKWGLVGTYTPVILLALTHSFQIFFFRQHFKSLPQELFDAARVDGLGFFRCYWTIAMPLSRPVTAAMIIYTALLRWNDFLYALIYLTDESLYTVQLGLAAFQHKSPGFAFGPLMAITTFISIPIILVYLIFQRQFVRGIVMTGLKS